MGHHGRRHWRHNGAHLKVRSALGAGNALVGAAIGHKDERGNREPMLEPYENIDENMAAVVKVDERGRFLDGSNPKDLRARQAQEGSGDPTVVVATVIHVVLKNGSTVGKFTVPTLPATISNSDIGRVTIPAETDSPIVVPTSPPNSSPVPVPAPAPAPSGPNASVPGNPSGAPPEPTFGDPTSSIPDSSTPSSELPQSTTAMSSSSSATASGPSNVPPPAGSTASSPSSSTSTSTSPTSTPSTSTSAFENVTRPTFIVLPIASNSTSVASTPAAAPIGLLPSKPAPQVLPSTDSGSTTSTISASFPLSSALLASTSSTTFSSPLSLSATSSTASASSSNTRSSKSVLSPTYLGGFGGGRGGGGGGGSGDPTGTGPGGLPTFAGGSPADNSDASSVPTGKVVGGVVGGVAGIVLLIVVALLLLRTRKRKGDPSRREDPGTVAILHTGVVGAMTERSASTATGGSALGATALFSKWRNSHQSTRTLEPPPSSERGFQRVSGRKIPSVLESGGDGYDDPFGPTGEKLYYETTSAAAAAGKEMGSPTTFAPIIPPSSSSFQPRPTISRNVKSRGAEPIAQPLPAPPLGRPPSQESDSSAHVVIRPSPARTPLTSSADITTTTTLATSGSIALHPPPLESLPRLPIHRRISGQDAIGRSMASSDGSRASRFTEGI
ncbi:hypothetical protein EMCG_08278 [[Emmonsia] crescens]|uniref:Uncharacterized protein n=1 Tax=[Emmonsia] crescens TaxID=73230 RepID=A0A0G2J4M0_9EURO|nr:hypothetical protein EMCG_08278 [Emmonsia crescens UAMH 3008]